MPVSCRVTSINSITEEENGGWSLISEREGKVGITRGKIMVWAGMEEAERERVGEVG